MDSNNKGRFSGNRRDDRGSRDNFRRDNFRDRDKDRNADRMMYQTVCDDCGKNCEVPFKPTGGKPVFCNTCFRKQDEMEYANPRPINDRGSDRKFSRNNDSDDREMFSAICDECGKKCLVPFKPTNDKPIFCSNCFRTKDNNPLNISASEELKTQLESIQKKLDKILASLEK
jgi:CxxC-x17-CxxC domain-containing protein